MGPEVPRRPEKLPTVSSSVRRLTTSVWFHQRVPAWALRFPHCCCCSQCRSGSCTHRHHPADLLPRSSNWVNNITLIRISEYVYTQNQKLTFHVSKKSQITGSLTGQIIPPLRLRSEHIQHLSATTLNWIIAKVEYRSSSILDKQLQNYPLHSRELMLGHFLMTSPASLL